MKKYKTIKGIEIHSVSREGKSWEWIVRELILGRIYQDKSFGKYIRAYNDENNIFQIEFLKGSDVAYTFLPECTELIDFMKEGITGSSLGMLADYLIKNGWKEVNKLNHEEFYATHSIFSAYCARLLFSPPRDSTTTQSFGN